MYLLNVSQIPTMVPVLDEVQLKPWFSSEILQQGLQLLRQQRVEDFTWLREVVGAVFDGETIITMRFEKSAKLRQGFVIRHRWCALCRSKKKGECAHTAALALLCLDSLDESQKPIPFPLAFRGSDWEKIGRFLEGWLGRSACSLRHDPEAGGSILEATTKDGGIAIEIPVPWERQARLVVAGGRPDAESMGSDLALAQLAVHIKEQAMTANERALRNLGSVSSGWKKDTSPWLWCARMLFCCHRDEIPSFEQVAGAFSFTLRQHGEDRQGSLRVDLPGPRAWKLIREVGFSSSTATQLPPAKECFQVYFNSDDKIEVVPSLRLQDGRVLRRKKLAAWKFQGGYYLAGEGFLPSKRVPAEGAIRSSPLTESMPLLGFMQEEPNRDAGFIVEINAIPTFLETNRRALGYEENIVASEVQAFQVRMLPDRLVVDHYTEQRGWCYLSCHYGLGSSAISLDDIRKARQQGLERLPGRDWLQITETPLSWLYELPEDRFGGDGSVRLSYREMLALTGIVGEVDIKSKDDDSRSRLQRLLDTSGWLEETELTRVPDHLRKYQRMGLAWLARLADIGLGGLLADDMGLGKTHQALAMIEWRMEVKGDSRHLVICPASVLWSWAEKIERFYPGLEYLFYYGAQRSLESLAEKRVVLTTYGVARQDLDVLRQEDFDLIIIDEIQYCKNSKTQAHRAVAALNGRVKIGLTGTPVENSLLDLHALFSLCLPGYLGSAKEFNRNYAEPMAGGNGKEATAMLNRLIHPFILRRSRKQVLTELPAVIEDDRICELSEQQVGLYLKIVAERQTVLEELADGNSAVPYMNILAMITLLKQVCNHPALVVEEGRPEEYASGKWDLFVELSRELLDGGMKFVVFSQYTAMLDLIEDYFFRQGIAYATLRGDMALAKRKQQIAAFNEDESCRVFCASLLAGGTGIDLTSAQAVIHYDRWWNPAKEEQATARVHRMGQKHSVQVFRLITRGTLEEKIHHLLRRKTELADSVLQEDEAGIIKQMGRNELAGLFRLSPSPV